MNNILKLSGAIKQRSRKGFGMPSLPTGSVLYSESVKELISDIDRVIAYWEKQTLGFMPLVSVYYRRIVAKSNRISSLLSSSGKKANDSIVGAKFSDSKQPRHIITHCVTIACLYDTLDKLKLLYSILLNEFDGEISSSLLLDITKGRKELNKKWKLSSIIFAQIVKDCYYVLGFGLPSEHHDIKTVIDETQIITIYNTGLSFSDVVYKLGLENQHFDRLDDTTWLLNPKQYSILFQRAPYLVSMSLTNWKEIVGYKPLRIEMKEEYSIKKPTKEPIIGVIDTLFSKDVYFSDWVEYHCMLDKNLIDAEDYHHGTAVSSIIVDGPALNPHLEDGCGHFKVRHFGIAKAGRNSAFQIVKMIQEIVLSNKDIKVWNLSLGSELETAINCISPEAALLDRLQNENDVIFVVAGTNNNNRRIQYPRLGSPADSLNSIVVNSITLMDNPANYSRRGPVLGFFSKPDVSAFGGDEIDPMVIYSSRGREKVWGTSFASPWVARKLAYLIYIMKFPKEVAKALLIDAAAGWNTDMSRQSLLGFGKIPLRIEDILKTKNDEIKFIIQGTMEKHESYAYNIPVPKKKGKYPFTTKATLCYFPSCSRSQGVDYTDTELDFHFGRLNGEGRIKTVNNNIQGEPGIVLYEEEARKYFGKWENVKHICEGLKNRGGEKKIYKDSNNNDLSWGFCIKKTERLDKRAKKGIAFGLVVTLKEIHGENRIQDFIQMCEANNWFVHEVDVQTMVENYIEGESDIIFEE